VGLTKNEGNFKTGLEAAITLSLMSLVPVFIKLTAATPITIALFRLGVATATIGVFLHWKTVLRVLYTKALLALVAIGLFFAAHWITYFLSIKKATASIGILGMSTYGIHLMLLGWWFSKQKPGPFDFLALVLAFGGTFLIIPEFSFGNTITIGILLGVLSGFCFAVLPILHQHCRHIPERVRIFGQFLSALLVFAVFLPAGNWNLRPIDWWSLIYLAIPGTVIAHSLWVRVTTGISTTISSLIFYLIIPMTMTISHIWLGEPMPFVKIMGAALIVGGNLLIFVNKLGRRIDRGRS
jgi:drug/metabolite transporter (DMT)-like permease